MPPLASTGTTAELATISPAAALMFDVTGRAPRPDHAVKKPGVLGATKAKFTSTAFVTAGSTPIGTYLVVFSRIGLAPDAGSRVSSTRLPGGTATKASGGGSTNGDGGVVILRTAPSGERVVQRDAVWRGDEGHVGDPADARGERTGVVDRSVGAAQPDVAAAGIGEQVAAVELRGPVPVGDERGGGDVLDRRSAGSR